MNARTPKRLYDALKGYLPRDVRAQVSRLAWASLDLGWTLPTGVSISIHDLADFRTYNEIFVDQDYDAAIQRALDGHGGHGPFQALDLGANVGFFTLRLVHLARRSGAPPSGMKVFAVEGSESVARRLRAALGAGGLGPTCTVSVLEGLAGRRSGSASFEEAPFHVTNRASDDGAGRRVDYIDLDHVSAELEVIHLLKCDIEGSEAELIANYPVLLAKVRIAVFELHERLCDVPAALRGLKALGFEQLDSRRVGPDCFVATFAKEP
jgi:FkbM family methyltransferase